jgi:hypothetical protein
MFLLPLTNAITLALILSYPSLHFIYKVYLNILTNNIIYLYSQIRLKPETFFFFFFFFSIWV